MTRYEKDEPCTGPAPRIEIRIRIQARWRIRLWFVGGLLRVCAGLLSPWNDGVVMNAGCEERKEFKA